MTLELSSSPTDIRTYTAPPDFRTKADAKIALACLAAEQGAVEFLRFRGNPPPPDYQTFHATLSSGMADILNKRKGREDDGPQERKKSKMGANEGERHVSFLETKDEATSRFNVGYTSRPYQSRDTRPGNHNGWKNHHGPGSSGFGAISRPSQGPPISQIRSGGRPVNNSTLTYGIAGPPLPPAFPTAQSPGPQAPAMLPGPPRAGPVILGNPGSHHSLMPGHGRLRQSGPQVEPPRPDPYAPRPPVEPFSQAGPYSVSPYGPAPLMTGYYPLNTPPCPIPRQYPRTGPFSFSAPPSHYPQSYDSSATPEGSRGSFPEPQYPPHFPRHPPLIQSPVYHSFPDVIVSPATAPTPDSSWALPLHPSSSWEIPLAPAILDGIDMKRTISSYGGQNSQTSHNSQCTPAPVTARSNQSTDEQPASKSYQPMSCTDDSQLSNKYMKTTVTPTPVTKSHVALLLGAFLSLAASVRWNCL